MAVATEGQEGAAPFPLWILTLPSQMGRKNFNED